MKKWSLGLVAVFGFAMVVTAQSATVGGNGYDATYSAVPSVGEQAPTVSAREAMSNLPKAADVSADHGTTKDKCFGWGGYGYGGCGGYYGGYGYGYASYYPSYGYGCGYGYGGCGGYYGGYGYGGYGYGCGGYYGGYYGGYRGGCGYWW